MIVFAILFAGLAALGVLVGLEHVGQPIGGQSLVSYGWALGIDASVIAGFLVYMWFQRPSRIRS